MKKIKKWLVILALLTALSLTGCGSTPRVLKEFQSEDESMSISMDETWKIEDMGLESCLAAFNEDGSEGIVVLQLPKILYASSVSDMEDVKELSEEIFDTSELKSAESIAIPGLENVETYSGTVTADDVKGAGIVLYGETDYAFYSIMYAAPKMNGRKTEYFKEVCATFQEDAPEMAEGVPVTDTILWFNGTCAVLTKANGWDYTLFGGIEANPLGASIVQNMLDEWWGVTDRDTADETMEWLLLEGHRTSFVEDMLYIEESGIGEVPVEERGDFVLENYEVDEEEAESYADWYTAYEESGESAIAAWDYSRAMSLLGYYYLAGFYTQEEALDISLSLAEDIQAEFDSWDSFLESYFTGYEYWAEEDSGERRALYEEIKAASDSPYNLDFHMALEKSW